MLLVKKQYVASRKPEGIIGTVLLSNNVSSTLPVKKQSVASGKPVGT
jgi:hypothetical protein